MQERGYGYPGFADFARRTALPKRALVTLAEADAFRGFGLDRREGLWAVRRLPDDSPLPLFAHEGNGGATPEMGTETIAPLPRMPESQEVVADYQTLRLSLKGYPTQFLRPLFDAEKIMPCAGLAALADGARARVAGVVLVRQRPGEGNAIFITLSDETGICQSGAVGKHLPPLPQGSDGIAPAAGRRQGAEKSRRRAASDGRKADRSQRRSQPSVCRRPRSCPFRVHRHPRNVRVLPPSRDFH